jgi:hypothetical protein
VTTQVTRYVTRWALTSGIVKVIGYYTEDALYFTNHGAGNVFVKAYEAYESLAAAQACACAMATKRAARLRAQADKLADPAWEAKVRT